MEYSTALIRHFHEHARPDQAPAMKAYMKDQFEFLGIKSPVRTELLRPFFLPSRRPPFKDLPAVVQALWNQPEREFQYAAMELIYLYRKEFDLEIIELFKEMVLAKSWWDTIDFISPKLMGSWFKKYPLEIAHYIPHWNRSGNLWMERSTILFQLKYKKETDTDLLEACMVPHHGSKAFFHRKAIGWALREYSKTNPAWVLDYVQRHELSGLSSREALKVIQKKP